MRISTRRLRAWSIGLLAVAATLGASAADAQLLQAVRNGDAAGVRELLGRDADVNVRQGDGATPLHWAAHLDDLETAGLLIRAGAAVDATNDLGATPLWVAATAGSAAMVASLLEARADPNLAPDTGGAPLMIAARQGNVAAVRSLLAHGADVNVKEGAQGQTALMWAVARRHPEVVRVLLDAGADLHARTKSSRRHVLLCCQKSLGKTEGAVWVEQGGFTPLLFAARHGDAASAELLLAAGAPIDATAAAGTTALVVAAQHGFHDVAAVLLAKGADPDAAGRRTGGPALGGAARRPRAGGNAPGPRRQSGRAARAGLAAQAARHARVRLRQVPGRRDAVRAAPPGAPTPELMRLLGRRRRRHRRCRCRMAGRPPWSRPAGERRGCVDSGSRKGRSWKRSGRRSNSAWT